MRRGLWGHYAVTWATIGKGSRLRTEDEMLIATLQRGRHLRRRRRLRLYGVGGAVVCVAVGTSVVLWRATNNPSQDVRVASQAPAATASTTGSTATTAPQAVAASITSVTASTTGS